jgi:DNA-binding Lrp family transcriptional regulator
MSLIHGDYSVDFALVRPWTTAFKERDDAAAWRKAVFPATVSQGCRIRIINFEDSRPEIGALEELILPVGQGIKSGAYGQLTLGIVSSDEPIVHYVEFLAEKHNLPLFVAPQLDKPLESSEPVGKLTSGEISTLEKVQELGGRVKSSELAKALGIELAAAGNRLAKLEKKGYLLRIPQSPREGDIYVDPRQALSVFRSLESNQELSGYVPLEIRDAVTELAERQGRTPHEVVGEVWRDFFVRNQEELGQHFLRIGKLFDSGDQERLAEELGTDLDDWAEQAATAWDDA